MNSQLKDTHREKGPSNKTPALRKSTNMGVWAVGKTRFSVIGPLCSYHSICLNIGF